MITPDGDYLVDPVYFYGPEAVDGYAMKFDATGKVLWRTACGTTAAQEWFRSAEAMPDGGFVLAGQGFGGPWVVRIDSAGSVLWQKRYGTGAGYAARAVSDGGIVLIGAGNQGLIVAKLDGGGNPGVCTDLTIGVDTAAVERSSTARASAGKAGAVTPSTTASDTAATPLASNALESQLCTS